MPQLRYDNLYQQPPSMRSTHPVVTVVDYSAQLESHTRALLIPYLACSDLPYSRLEPSPSRHVPSQWPHEWQIH